jgi:four helix bundle protein
MAYGSFEDLEVWQRACSLAVDIYKVLENCRDFGLKDQMTRAAISIASNIAEGAERGPAPYFIRLLHMSKGSATELRTQVYIACRIQVISDQIQKKTDQRAEKHLKDDSRSNQVTKARNLKLKT